MYVVLCVRPLQANPDPNTCLGVFGLSLYTTERDLREVFSRYGPLAGVNVVYDQRTGRSRGFAFVYFERIDDAKEVRVPRALSWNHGALHSQGVFTVDKKKKQKKQLKL